MFWALITDLITDHRLLLAKDDDDDNDDDDTHYDELQEQYLCP